MENAWLHSLIQRYSHFGGSLLGPSERRVYRSQLGLVCGDLRGTVGSWPASGDSVKGQEESKCPFLGHPSFSVNVPLLPGPLRWHFAQRHRPKASPWWPLPSAAPGLLPPVSLSRGVPPSDGSWAQGRLKAPLNRLCVVRGDSHTKRPEADRLHPGALAGLDPWAGNTPWRKKWPPHSSLLACRIPWTEEPGGLQSTGSQGSDTTAEAPGESP